MILFVSPTYPVVADFARHHHINCLFHHSDSQPSVDAHFQSLHRSSATHCHLTSNHPRLSLPVFRQRLKTFLFRQSFANIVLCLYCAFMDFVAVCYFSHVKTISLTLTLTLLTGCSIQQTATTAGAVRVLVVSRADQRQCMNRPAVAAAR